MGPRLTAIVLTLNEEQHLSACLESLRLITDVLLVVDSGSTDQTLTIAERAGARVAHRTFDGYGHQRNAAIDLAGDAEWILFLDADERLTPEGVREIRKRLSESADVAAYWIPRRNIFWGRALRGGGWWPDEQARLFRRGRARYDDDYQVHEVAVIDGASARLLEPMLHDNYDSRREFVIKQRAYTAIRVREAQRRGLRPRRRAYVAAPLRELHRRLITHRGYRDGATGLFLATMLAIEELRAVWLTRRRSAQ